MKLLLLALAIAGCGDDDESPSPRLDPDASVDDANMPRGCVPMVRCPADLEVSCTGDRTRIDVPLPRIEGCPGTTLMSDAPETFSLGETIVTFRAGEQEACAMHVRVVDDGPPELACDPELELVQTSPDAPARVPIPPATDACDATPTVRATPAELTQRGGTTIQFEATDAAGQTTRCTTRGQLRRVFTPEHVRIAAEEASDGSTRIAVAWDAEAGGDANGYAVERASTQTGPFTRVGEVSGSERTFVDALTADHAFYRVVSLRDGRTGGASAPLAAHAIRRAGYDLRGERVAGIDFATTLYGVISAPRELTPGAHPLVVLLHGNHGNCRASRDFVDDECTTTDDHDCHESGYVTTPNAEGLSYLGDTLAANGFVAVSISANALNCRTDAIEERARLIIAHLAKWSEWHSGGAPFDASIAAAVDLERIGLAGHSRGGEAVALAPSFLRGAPLPGVAVRSVFAIAPTDSHEPEVGDAHYGVLLPTCDGDVYTLEGMHAYDRAIAAHDGFARVQVLFAGANHNFFNEQWLVDDDEESQVCPSLPPLPEATQRNTLEGIIASFFDATLRDVALEPLLKADVGRSDGLFARAGRDLDLRVSYASPHAVRIDDFEGDGSPDLNALGGANAFTGFYNVRRCGQGICNETYAHRRNAMHLAWDALEGRAALAVDAAPRELTTALSFRMAARASVFNESRASQELFVRVTDTRGGSAMVRLSELRQIATLYEASQPYVVLQTVRLPFSRVPGVDPRALASISLEMSAPEGAPASIVLTDLELDRD